MRNKHEVFIKEKTCELDTKYLREASWFCLINIPCLLLIFQIDTNFYGNIVINNDDDVEDISKNVGNSNTHTSTTNYDKKLVDRDKMTNVKVLLIDHKAATCIVMLQLSMIILYW